MSGPVLYTPFTRAFNHWLTNQNSSVCRELEMDFYRCASRIGYYRYQQTDECKAEYADLKECVQCTKQITRYHLMQMERRKQGRPYLEKPPDVSAQVRNHTMLGRN